MIPVWFPWIFVGGSLFILLSFLGSKYKDKEYRNIQYLQDFISGSIFVAFLGILIPDIFPTFQMPSFAGLSESSDFDLQIGPPRLIGR
jgi:hypothetical protein